MTYVDVLFDRKKDVVRVVEIEDGQKIFKNYPARHVFYYTHPAGSARSIFGDSCKKFETSDGRKFKKELAAKRNERNVKIFESDIRPEFRCLADNYRDAPLPELNVCFFDIEADWDPVRRYAPPHDPFNAVTAITMYLSEEQMCLTLALCPPTVDIEDARKISGKFDNTVIFDNEEDMLRAFLSLIENVSLFVGWNSESYDIPYLTNRIALILGEDATRAFCLWGQRPREREYLRYGKAEITYDFPGRPHLDYMQLYMKHVTQKRHSYKLDFIGALEVNETKVAYDGTLDDLYKKEFEKFIAYSRQDVMLLVKLDDKLRYIELHNLVAHTNLVDFKTTMGTVTLTETAIINDMHEMGMVVPDRKIVDTEAVSSMVAFDPESEEEYQVVAEGHVPVVGAYVAQPKTGLHEHVGAIDINSLYPSVLRSLNMSPETIIGQIRSTETENYIASKAATLSKVKKAEAWEGVFYSFEHNHMFNQDDVPLTIDFQDGSTKDMTGVQLYDYIFKEGRNLCITANGTIFRTDKQGIIPALLAKWYSERKAMQKGSKRAAALAEGVIIDLSLIDALS